MSLKLGITLGDVTGIGPEVALKALALELPEDDTVYALIGDRQVIHFYAGLMGLSEPLPDWPQRHSIPARVYVADPNDAPLPSSLLPGDRRAAVAAMEWLTLGASLCLSGELTGMVTAPVSKESIINAGFSSFVGQTEFLSELAKTERTAMMLLGCDDRGRWLRVALATVHLPLKQVATALTKRAIEKAIELASESCALLGLPRRRVAVCGLNPHAGEGGKMGTEEIELIAPTVLKCRRAGIDVHGPFAADTLFHRVYRGDFDAVVAMYHDQGLVPLKMIGFESGVNWTLGLPFVRTSPDHGTAFDIAGRGVAHPGSMRSAIRLARQIARARQSAESV